MAKSSFPSLVASAGARSELLFRSFDRASARRESRLFRKTPSLIPMPTTLKSATNGSSAVVWSTGMPSAELRRRAYQAKLQMRAQHAAALAATAHVTGQASLSFGSWMPLGPMPLASDATGNGTQDYHQVSGRATAIAIDPADPTGNTVYIGGAQSGVWKSTNAANNTANSVTWTPVTDDQATLSIGAIAIQPGNADPTKTVILAATGEADNSGDSYFGLGILRSTDAGSTWTLIPTANSGALSFSGLGGTRMAFSTASGQTNTVVSAMATTSEGMVDGAVTANTTRGLYTSLDAGQTWTYDALVDPGGATDATSATSVVYNASAGLFFAAVRYHGFYSSPDGVTWTRLAGQPGGAVLSTTACPPQSTSNNYACPIYRAEITVVPGRNEMYAWYISLDSTGSPVDGGIWHSFNGGASWTFDSPTLPSRIAATSMAAACNRAPTTWNCWPFRTPIRHGLVRGGDQSLQVPHHFAESHVRGLAVHEPHARLRMRPDWRARSRASRSACAGVCDPEFGQRLGQRADVLRQRWRHLPRAQRICGAQHRRVFGYESVRRSQPESGIDDAVRQLLAASNRREHVARRNAG